MTISYMADCKESRSERPPEQQMRTGRGPITSALEDISEGFLRAGLWWELAWEDFVKRYRRSYFGVLWAIISFAILSIAILFFFSSITGEQAKYTTGYIVLGFLVFQSLSMNIVDSCNVFVSSSNWLKSTKLPLSIFVFKDITRNLIMIIFNSVGAAMLLAWAGYRFPPEAYWALAGVIAIILNSVWVYLLFGVIAARFRDIFHLTSAIMRMAFFVTPIMWTPSDEGIRSLIALFNPLTHFIAIVRNPLLNGEIPYLSWQIVGGISVFGSILGLTIFCLCRRRVVYWV